MYKTIVVLLLISCVALGAQRKTFTLAETQASLAQIDQDEFGKAILSAIELNLAVKNPLEELNLIIEGIQNDIRAEQEDADSENRTNQQNCETAINNLVDTIRTHNEAIARLTADIASKEELLRNDRVALEQAQNDYDETVEAINTGTAQREAEHARWAEEDYQNSISIATLEEGVKLINHMIHGVAFSQIKTRYDKVLEKLRDSENKHATLFKPLITTLTQLASKLNYENVMKILELLRNIREGIVADQTRARDEEETAQTNWEVLLNQLTQLKQNLADKIQRLTNEIAQTEEQLTQCRASLANHQEGLALAQDALASEKAKCLALSVTYLSETAKRDRYLDILDRVSSHLEERLGAITDYIASR